MATSTQDTSTIIKPNRRVALVSGCTMKEYDQLISDLKKENFSLKLRIYYTEERLQQTFGDGQDVLKMNVQLQTEIDSLKQELIDKQVLIQKAAFAMESLTADRGKEEETIRNRLRADYEKELTQLHDQLDKANQRCDVSHSEVEKVRKEAEVLKQQLHGTTTELNASNKTSENLEKALEEMKLGQRQKDTLLDRYKRSVEGLVRSLQQKNEECEGLKVGVNEGSEQIKLLQTEIRETKLQSSKVHDLSLKLLRDVKMLIDFLQEEMKSFSSLHQQLKDNTGENTNVKAWLTETSSVQRIYQKLQKGVEKSSQLYQTLMCSVQARQGHSDSLESSSHNGHKLEPVLQIPGCGALSSSQGKAQSGVGSFQQTSAETGKEPAPSGVLSSPGHVGDKLPASYSVVNEVAADADDSFLQSDAILSNINWWLQMPPRVEGEGEENSIKVNENADLNQAQQSQSDPTGENPEIKTSSVNPIKDFRRGILEINISGVDPVKDFRRGIPEINISCVDAVKDLKSNLEVVSRVDSLGDVGRGNPEINVPSFDAVEGLKGNPVDDLRQVSGIDFVNSVTAHPIVSPHRSSSVVADGKEEDFGTYSDNFHRFQHAAFFDEDHFDFHRHDRASSVKFDSQNLTLTGRTVSQHMTPTHISHLSTRDSKSSRSISDHGSLSQVQEALNIRSDTQQSAEFDQNILGSQQQVEVDQNILGGQQQAEVDQNILGSQQQAEVDQNILGSQQQAEVDQNILGSQQQVQVDQNILGSQQQVEVDQNILGSQQQAEVDQNILGSQQQVEVDQNIPDSQDSVNVEVNTQIKDLEEKLQATENTVKLLSRKNKIYLSALKAAGVHVNFMGRSNSESCLDSFSVSTRKRASSVGSLSILTPGRNNESIERPRSYVCDTLNHTGDVTCGSLAASIVATPSVTTLSLVDDAVRISEMGAHVLNHTTQSCTSNLNATISQNKSMLVIDHLGNVNSNNHNTSCVGNVSAPILTFPASPPASMAGSRKTSPHKDLHRISLSSEGHHHTTPILNCLNQFSSQDHTSMDTLVRSDEDKSRVKSSLDVSEVGQNEPREVTYSSIVDGSWMNHRASLDGSVVSQSRHPDVTYSSIVDNPLMNHGLRSSVDMSVVSRARSPDVTFSSIMDGSLMNRLLNNLEHSLSALKEDTWNVSDLSVGQLRNHVEHLERVNLTLKEEIRVYEILHRLQTSRDHLSDSSSSHQSKTGRGLSEENLLKSYSESKKSQVLSEEDLLRQYLIEIKKIRQRLERLDLVKDPDQLLIFQSHTHQRIVHQETVIVHLQQMMVEKETQWQQEISALQHKLSREKILAVEKLECTISQLQTTLRDQAEAIREQERQIVDLKLSLDLIETNVKHKEEEMMKGEKSDLEAQLTKLSTACVEGKKLENELEEKQKEIGRLKMELEKEKESWRHLKEIVVKRERSLQEKMLVLHELTSEKAAVEDTVKEKEDEVRKLELELGDLREKMQEMKVALEERTLLMDKVELLREDLRERENEVVRYDFQKMRYDAEIEKITEERVKLSMDLELESREKEELKVQLHEWKHKTLEGVKLERQNSELKGEIKSLLGEVDRLNAKLGQRVVKETEVRARLRMLGGVQSQVSMLREQLLKAEDSLKVAEQFRNSAVDEVKDREERLKKRNQQLHHLLQQYKKLEAAFTKQKAKLKEKTDLLQRLKKQIQLHDPNLTCSSDQSLNETKLSLDSESYLDAALTSTPVSSHQVKQCCDSMSPKHCRRQLTYSAAETQPTETSPGTAGSNTFRLVAVLTRDCHDRLHKKTEECLLILAEIELRLDHRLGVYKMDSQSENMEYSILRETSASCQRLDNCLREAAGWLAAARITELPDSRTQAPNYHSGMCQQNGNLRHEIKQLPSHDTASQSLIQQQNKPHETHKTWENTLYKQLYKTTRDLEQAKENIDASLTGLPPTSTTLMSTINSLK